MSDGLTLLPYGPRAVLVELPDSAARRALTRWLREQAFDGVDIVPAESTVLLDVSDPAIPANTVHDHLAHAVRRLRGLDLGSLPPEHPGDLTPLTIEVRYDGPDLAASAAALGRSIDGFVDWHTASPWRVEFLGFMPGFGYLTRPDHRQAVERRSSPRSSIPAGSVGLAGSYCGIYPRSSPGGWQLIGRTDQVLFDPAGAGAVLTPDAGVQFRAIR